MSWVSSSSVNFVIEMASYSDNEGIYGQGQRRTRESTNQPDIILQRRINVLEQRLHQAELGQKMEKWKFESYKRNEANRSRNRSPKQGNNKNTTHSRTQSPTDSYRARSREPSRSNSRPTSPTRNSRQGNQNFDNTNRQDYHNDGDKNLGARRKTTFQTNEGQENQEKNKQEDKPSRNQGSNEQPYNFSFRNSQSYKDNTQEQRSSNENRGFSSNPPPNRPYNNERDFSQQDERTYRRESRKERGEGYNNRSHHYRFREQGRSRKISSSSEERENPRQYKYEYYPTQDLGAPEESHSDEEEEGYKCKFNQKKYDNYFKEARKFYPRDATDDSIHRYIKAQIAWDDDNWVERNNYSRYDYGDDSTVVKKPRYLKKSKKFNAAKVHEQINLIKKQVIYLENCPFPTFIEQFKAFGLDNHHVTEPEFNVIVATFVGRTLKDKMAKANILPTTTSTTQYLKELARYSNNNMTYRDIERKLGNFNSQSNDIFDIFNEVTGLQNMLPEDIMSDNQKNRQLKYILEKFIPKEVKTLLNESWISRRSTPPNRDVLKNFIDRHSESINDHLKGKRNKVHKTQSTSESSSEENDNVPPKANKPYRRKKVHKANVEEPKEWNKDKNKAKYANTSGSEESEYESDQGIHKIKQSKAHSKKYQESKVRNCTNCKRKGHTVEVCFRHPDKDIALKNQQARNVNICMLCSSPNHLSPNCPIYPGLIPCYVPCQICEDAGFFERFHPSTKCKQEAQNQREIEGEGNNA